MRGSDSESEAWHKSRHAKHSSPREHRGMLSDVGINPFLMVD